MRFALFITAVCTTLFSSVPAFSQSTRSVPTVNPGGDIGDDGIPYSYFFDTCFDRARRSGENNIGNPHVVTVKCDPQNGVDGHVFTAVVFTGENGELHITFHSGGMTTTHIVPRPGMCHEPPYPNLFKDPAVMAVIHGDLADYCADEYLHPYEEYVATPGLVDWKDLTSGNPGECTKQPDRKSCLDCCKERVDENLSILSSVEGKDHIEAVQDMDAWIRFCKDACYHHHKE